MSGKELLRADAIFELGLGVALLIGVASGALGAADFPSPVGGVVVAVVGVLLLGAAALIWRGVSLGLLAIGNLVTAAAAVAWLGLAAGFSTAGLVVLVVTTTVLVCLATAELATLRR